MPLPSIHLDQKISNVQRATGAEASGPRTLVFLKIRSIFSESPEVRNDVSSNNLLVSGMLFGLVSEFNQKGAAPG